MYVFLSICTYVCLFTCMYVFEFSYQTDKENEDTLYPTSGVIVREDSNIDIEIVLNSAHLFLSDTYELKTKHVTPRPSLTH